jgi:hypothetical protein
MWIEDNLNVRQLRTFIDRAILFNIAIDEINVRKGIFTVVYKSVSPLTDTSRKYLKVTNSCT